MKTLNVLFVTVVGGLLVIYFQQKYLSPSNLEGVEATAISGPWAPMVPSEVGKVVDLETEWPLIEENNAIARIVITNNGTKTITQARIRADRDPSFPDALVTNEKTKKGVFLKDVKDIPLPELAPGDRITVFFFSQFGFGWPSYLDSTHIYSELGEIPIELSTHRDAAGYGDENRDLNFLQFVYQFWWIILGIFAVIAIIMTMISEAIQRNYIKKVLLDDDFWLAERQKIEEKGHKYFAPDLSNLTLPPHASAEPKGQKA